MSHEPRATRHAPRATSPRGNARAFTLIEVLAAVAVLIIGFAGVIALLYGSFVQGHIASDRNVAGVLIPEAVRQIELDHLITSETIAAHPAIPADREGLFVQTLQDAVESDDKFPYGDIAASGGVLRDGSLAPLQNLNEWPRRPSPPAGEGGIAYRVRYRLEQHPHWQPHDADGAATAAENVSSPYRGVYVLSLCVYKDTQRDMSSPVQVSDPVVVYLRAR